jgi:hypothetical protein
MTFKCKRAEYLFPHDNSNITLLSLAIASLVSICGIFVIWLWIAHTPPALSVSDAAHRNGRFTRKRPPLRQRALPIRRIYGSRWTPYRFSHKRERTVPLPHAECGYCA